jgi:hypothetical protein
VVQVKGKRKKGERKGFEEPRGQGAEGKRFFKTLESSEPWPLGT